MTQDFARRTILLVDDDPTMRAAVASSLRAAGCHHVLQAGDGEQALQAVRGAAIDLVICDCQMTPMDGLTFLRHLRETPEGRELRVIMLTASDRPEDAWVGRELKVAAWLIKPITPKTVIRRVAAVLGFAAEGTLPEDTLAELADAYERRLPNEVATLDSMVRRLASHPQEFDRTCEELVRRLHVVKGQAGTLGYALLGAVAGQAHDVLRDAEDAPEAVVPMRADIQRLLNSTMAVLRIIVERRLRGGGGAGGVKVLEDLARFADPLHARIHAAVAEATVATREKRDRMATQLRESEENRVVNERRLRMHQAGLPDAIRR
jgi:two-component system chemotaxis response regulator CheY